MAARTEPVVDRCPSCQQRTLVKRGPMLYRGGAITWLSCTACNVVGWPRCN